MNSSKNAPRLLGLAFLLVLFLTFSEIWALSLIGSGTVSESLAAVSDSITQLRISILLGLILAVAIIVLAVLLFITLNRQSKIIALVALGLYLLEAITVVMRQMSIYALIPLTQEYAKAGSPDTPHFETAASMLLNVGQWVYDVHLWFFALGAILWYILFYKSKTIPRPLSIWGIVAAALVWIASVLALFEVRTIALILPNALFELTIGVWLVVKGIRDNPETG